MTTLQKLLNLGLIDLDSDDSRFSKMEAASKEFVKKLKSKPDLIIPATLICINNDVEEKEPLFDLVESLIIKKWKTMRNTHTNQPRELLRAIITDSIVKIAEEKPEIASIVWQTAISPLNHSQAKLGKEADLVKNYLQNFSKYAEHEAVSRINLTEPTFKRQRQKSPISKETFEIKSYTKLKDNEFIEDVKRAAGPHDNQNQAPPDPNPHWPSGNQNWVSDFSPRMSKAIAKAVNLGMNRISDTSSLNIQQLIEAFEKQRNDNLNSSETIQKELLRSFQSYQIRMDALWWYEAKYSPTLMLGYRELSETNAAFGMANDLSKIVPPLVPASLTYLLGEAVTDLFHYNSDSKPQTIISYLTNLNKDGSMFLDIVPKPLKSEMRQPLSELALEAIHGTQIKSKEVQTRTGIDPSLKLTLPDFSMWMFRDFQARKLVEEIK
jgi:GTPase-associated system helical domain